MVNKKMVNKNMVNRKMKSKKIALLLAVLVLLSSAALLNSATPPGSGPEYTSDALPDDGIRHELQPERDADGSPHVRQRLRQP